MKEIIKESFYSGAKSLGFLLSGLLLVFVLISLSYGIVSFSTWIYELLFSSQNDIIYAIVNSIVLLFVIFLGSVIYNFIKNFINYWNKGD